ncbi:MAG: DMT family transporter [Spirochaetales bacterium]|nr:DMT family transporter [Spirochaetales bacterium]
MSKRFGMLVVVVSAVSFGMMPLFAQLAYDEGVSTVSLLFFRFGVAAIVMTAVVLRRGDRFPRRRALVGLALMGGVGYVGQSFSFFSAMTLANVGLAVILLYLHPAIVAVLSVVLLRERLTPLRAGAVALAFVGTVLTVGPQLDARPLGVLFGVASAVIYSGYIMVGTRTLKNTSPLSGSVIVMASAGLVFGGLAAAQGLTVPTSVVGWTGILGVAVVSTVVAVTLFLVGLTAIGPTNASVLSTFEPVTAVVLAALFLDEPIGVAVAAGGACILGAAIILARTSDHPATRAAQ